MAKIGITETVLRDAHQSLIATRMSTEEMLPILAQLDKVGYHSLEAWGGATFDSCMRFLNEDPWDRLRKLKKAYSAWQNKLCGKGWNMLYIENHDHPRIVSRYGSEKFREESAKMLAVSYMFQKGTPFVYQGQEIGMVNWYPNDPSLYEDVQTRWQYEHVALNKSDEKRLQRLWHGSRDSSRTPVQWSDEENAGFPAFRFMFPISQMYYLHF